MGIEGPTSQGLPIYPYLPQREPMKLFQTLTELVSLAFRKDTRNITLRPNQSVTYTADRDIQLPPQNADGILVSADSTQTLTNKTISGSSNTISDIDVATQITGIVPPANGGTGVANSSDLTYGPDDVTLTTTGATSLTLPTSGTLATLTGMETLENKTIDGDSNTVQDLALSSLKTVPGDADKAVVRDAFGAVVSGNVIPDSSDLVTEDATQVLTNKSLDTTNDIEILASRFALKDDIDPSAEVVFDLSGVSTATTRTLTVPDADTELVGTGTTQTLTGKTIDADYNTISNLEHGVEVDNPSSGVHGVTGNVVGTSDAQTLTNKTISGSDNTLSDIDYSSLVLTGSIDNDDISGSAGIAYSKLDLTGSVDLTSDVTGTLPYASGGTGANTAQAAFDGMAPGTTKGDLVAHDGTNHVRLPAGSDGQVLTADSGETTGYTWTAPLTNPMTTEGDIIVGGVSGAANRLGVGSDNSVLYTDSGTPAWSSTSSLSFNGTTLSVGGSTPPTGPKLFVSDAYSTTTAPSTNSVAVFSDTSNDAGVTVMAGAGNTAFINLRQGDDPGVHLTSDAAGTFKVMNNNGVNTRLAIDSSGNVLVPAVAVGTTNTTRRLVVYSTDTVVARFLGNRTNVGYIVENWAAGDLSDQLFLDFAVNSGGTHIGGIRRAGTSSTPEFYSTSDRRIKDNITPMQDVLDKVAQLNLVDYTYKSNPTNKGQGLIAQEVYEIFPDKVSVTDDGLGEDLPEGTAPWTLGGQWEYILLKAVQELKEKNDDLEARLAALEGNDG